MPTYLAIRRSRPLSGFTLVELLVSIAIIGMLVALLLPAVQAARESARRSQCSNNLRQIALAMHNFESSHGVLPAGYLSNSAAGEGRFDETYDALPGWGWGAQILPFLEEGSLASNIDLEQALSEGQFDGARRTTIDLFLCPSSSGPREPLTVRNESGDSFTVDGFEIQLGRSHYVASHGQESCWSDCGAPGPKTVFVDIYATGDEAKGPAEVPANGDLRGVSDGPFYRNSATRFAEVTDGLSKTIFLGEHSSSLSDKTWVGVLPGAATTPRFESGDNGPDSAATLVLVHAGPSGGEQYENSGLPIIHPINFPTLHVGQMYAEHPNGGNVALGDGSVRFVTDDVDLYLWAEYSSHGEGEVSNDEL